MYKKLTILAAATCCAAIASATPSVLVFTDYVVGSDNFVPAATSLGYTVTSDFSEAAFISDLTLNTYSAVVLNVQGYSEPSASAALATYIAGGGKAIATSWYIFDSTLANACDAGYTGSYDMNAISNDGMGVYTGVSGSPIAVINPGGSWGIYTMGLTANAGGVGMGHFENGDTAIVMGNGGRTFFNGFLTDTAANGADYQAIYKNELSAVVTGSLPAGSSVPGPSALLAFGIGALGRVIRRKRA